MQKERDFSCLEHQNFERFRPLIVVLNPKVGYEDAQEGQNGSLEHPYF